MHAELSGPASISSDPLSKLPSCFKDVSDHRAGAVVQRDDLVEVRLAVGDAGQAEDGPGRVVRVAGHAHAHFLADRDHSVQEVLEVLPEVVPT